MSQELGPASPDGSGVWPGSPDSRLQPGPLNASLPGAPSLLPTPLLSGAWQLLESFVPGYTLLVLQQIHAEAPHSHCSRGRGSHLVFRGCWLTEQSSAGAG